MVEDTAISAPAGGPVIEINAPTMMSLKRYCMDLSVHDKRVELIGGFEHSERVAGRLLDTKEAFDQRYADFATATPK